MGNEIEIKDLDTRSTSFLPAEIRDIDGITEIYSLEDEFAKTKKNRNLGLYASIGLFFLLVIASAFIFSLYVQSKNQNVEINISEFEDLRLKEVIDSARSHENNLDLLLIKLEILKVDQSKKILEIKQSQYRKELALLARELPVDRTDTGLAQIRATERRQIAAVNKEFENQIKAQEQEIEDIKRELAEKKAAEESGQADAISNIDRLNELKMAELKKSNDSGVISLRQYYENYIKYLTSLYNPRFATPHIKNVLNSAKSKRVRTVTGYHPVLQQEGVVSYGEYQQLKRKNSDNYFLLNRIQRIPYKGTVAPSLSAISVMSKSIESDYERLLRKSANVIRYKNGIIGNYAAALDLMLADSSENGYIINADNTKAIHVHLHEMFGAPIDKTATVFREDDEYIGRIRITKTEHDGILRARLVALAKGKSFQPFDKILLEIN